MKKFKAVVSLPNFNDSGNSDDDGTPMGLINGGKTKFKRRQIFTNEEKLQLVNYLVKSSRIC